METIGFLELNSIAKGMEAADAMLKAAATELIFARPGCPGKYYILITGDVSAVKASVSAGAEVAGGCVIEELVIPRIHPQVIPAIRGITQAGELNAAGILEFFSVTASILAADAAAKAADIELIEVRLGTGIGGKSFVVMTGEVSAVAAGVSCGAEAGGREGMLLNKVVIPNPRKELFEAML